jgi:hypothetical protein
MEQSNFFSKNFKWLSLIAVAVIALLLLQKCDSISSLSNENARLKAKEKILSGNILVMKDTMRYWKDKNSNSLSSISILTADKAMLKDQFKDLNSKYKNVLGKEKDDLKMISYLNSQIQIKEHEIADLKNSTATTGSRIINDSTIVIEVGKKYDTLNFYQVSGTVQTRIRDNTITTGTVDLTTQVNLGIELAIGRDEKTGIASITSKTAFPAKISLKGITQIENEINKKPSSYLGIGVFAGYGATIVKQPTLAPILGIGVYYSPSWLTIKLHKK